MKNNIKTKQNKKKQLYYKNDFYNFDNLKNFCMKLLVTIAFLNFTFIVFGQINYLNQIIDRSDSLYGFTGTKAMAKTSNNKYLYLTSQHGISTFKISPTGLLFIESKLDDTDLAYSINGIDAMTISLNNKYLLVASNSSSSLYQITIFKIDSTTGKLSFKESILDDSSLGIRGINSMCFSIDGKFLYTASSNDNMITCFNFDDNKGTLTSFQTIPRYTVATTKFYKIILSNDGRFAYTIDSENRGLSVFSRDITTGQLEYLKPVAISSNLPEHLLVKEIEMSKNGRNIYGYTFGHLIVFSQDSVGGDLTVSQIIDNTPTNNINSTLSSLAVSENQKYVYAASIPDTSLIIYSRDSISGNLTLLDSIKAFKKPLVRSSYANNIVSDGNNIYLSNYWESAIHQFRVDELNQNLDFSTSYISDAQSKIKGLFNATNIAISTDQKFIYVGTENDGMSVFKQKKGKNTLEFFQHINKIDLGISLNWGASQIIPSANQKWVFVISTDRNSLSVFERLNNDSLKVINTIYDNMENGLYRPNSLTYSNKTSDLYIGNSRSLSIFNFDTTTQTVNFKELYNTISSSDGFFDIQLTKDEKHVIGHNLSYSDIFLFKKDFNSKELYAIDLSYLKELPSPVYGSITSCSLTSDEENYLTVYNEANTLVNYTFLADKDSLVEIQRLNFDNLTINNKSILDINYIKIDKEGFMVYLFSKTEPKVAILQRDLNTNELHLVNILEENETTNGLDQVVGATFNEKDRKVYLVSKPERSLSVYNKELFIGLDQKYCAQDSMIIHSGAADSLYFWSNGSTDNSIKVNKSGVYTLKTITYNNKTLYDTISIEINPLPNINLGNDTSICFNDSLLLSVDTNFVAWWSNQLESNSIYAKKSGVYFVTIKDSNNCTNADTLVLNKYQPPTLTFENGNEFCTNDSITLSIKEKYPLYVWNDSLFSESITINKRALIHLEIEDSNTCRKKDSIQIFERELPYVYLPKDTLIQKYDSLKLYPLGFEIINTVWLDNIDIDTLVISPKSFASNPFQIWVSVENSYGCFNYDTITVSIDSSANGFKNHFLLYNLNIHPNPATSSIQIQNIDDKVIDGDLSLINSLGSLILTKKIEGSTSQIYIGEIPNGLYYIMIETNEGIKVTRKLIKQ